MTTPKAAPKAAPPPANVAIWAKKNPNRKRGRGVKSKAIYNRQISDYIRKEVGLFRSDADDFVRLFFEEITAALAAGSKVSLGAFGHFVVRQTMERERIDPNTSQPILVPVKRRVVFSTGNDLHHEVRRGLTLPMLLLPRSYRFPLSVPAPQSSAAHASSHSATASATDSRPSRASASPDA